MGDYFTANITPNIYIDLTNLPPGGRCAFGNTYPAPAAPTVWINNPATSMIIVGPFTACHSGQITKVRVYMFVSAATDCKAVVYDGSYNNLLGTSDVKSVGVVGSGQWEWFTFSTPVNVSLGTSYYLGICTEAADVWCIYVDDDNDLKNWYRDNDTNCTPPDPYAGDDSGSHRVCIYAQIDWTTGSEIHHKFELRIENTSDINLWFKIKENLAEWSIDSNGELGLLAPTAYDFVKVEMIRTSSPGSETSESGTFTLEAYSDPGYTNKVSDDTLDFTVYFEDLEDAGWSPDIDSFEADWDGWTTHTNLVRQDPANYAVDGSVAVHYDHEEAVATGIANSFQLAHPAYHLPNKNKVRVSFYLYYRVKSWDATTFARLENFQVCFGALPCLTKLYITKIILAQNEKIEEGFFKITADLSDEKDNTDTLGIIGEGIISGTGHGKAEIWIDRIIIAGKD